MSGDALVEIALHAVAHSRAGDKGNRLNISLFPYDPALYPLLAEQVTAERVHDLFRHRGATAQHFSAIGHRLIQLALQIVFGAL